MQIVTTNLDDFLLNICGIFFYKKEYSRSTLAHNTFLLTLNHSQAKKCICMLQWADELPPLALTWFTALRPLLVTPYRYCTEIIERIWSHVTDCYLHHGRVFDIW